MAVLGVATGTLLLSGCGGVGAGSLATPSSSVSPSPSPSTSLGSYAVFTSAVPPSSYRISVVGIDGRIVATATAADRDSNPPGGVGSKYTPWISLPTVTASNSRVYYLDGSSSVRSLTPDGANVQVTQVPGKATTLAAFAVSRDDRRIAVSTIDYATDPPSLRLYAEDLGGGNRVELFSSTSVYVWPVAWQGKSLVVAVGPYGAQYAANDPYDAINGYHVVDASTANRLATVCSPDSGLGPISDTGSLCMGNSNLTYLANWNGTKSSVPSDCKALSPSGTQVACGGSSPVAPISVVSLPGGTRAATAAIGFRPQGWIDANHLVFSADNGDSDVRVVELSSGAITKIGQYLTFQTRFGGMAN
jgi:hypothetical protein